MNDIIVHTPTLISDHHGLMVVCVEKCALCHKVMVTRPEGTDPFPRFGKHDLGAQLQRAGWVERSYSSRDGEPVCRVCADAGKADDFLCALCEERKPTTKEKEVFGDTPFEFLCTDCYESVTAKVWAEKKAALWEAHRYDFS